MRQKGLSFNVDKHISALRRAHGGDASQKQGALEADQGRIAGAQRYFLQKAKHWPFDEIDLPTIIQQKRG